MGTIPADLLAEMLPRATAWAEVQARYILEHGSDLNEHGRELARRAGVQYPERVRLLAVQAIPLPEEADLRQAAQSFDLLTEQTAGLTLGYGIFLVQRHLGAADSSLLAHELKHVAQCEICGGLGGFLQKYLSEVNEIGYREAPMELEARVFAESQFPSNG